jgi:NAD-dependent dihydropyrimidine dehydrogenase PreA subunit
VRVCPYSVFRVRKATRAERSGLGYFSRMKLFMRGGRQAFLDQSADGHGCGMCVAACPENAITLRKVG